MNIQATVTMGQLQNKIDQIGHNVANLNTIGYKSQSANFASLINQNIDNLSDSHANASGRQTPDGIRLGSGARLGQTNIDLSSGSIRTTDRGLDIALLEDNHLLQVEVNENGGRERRFTRDGRVYLNTLPDGDLMVATTDG